MKEIWNFKREFESKKGNQIEIIQTESTGNNAYSAVHAIKVNGEHIDRIFTTKQILEMKK